MKKLYILSILLISGISFAQSVVISRVVDGTLHSDGCAGSAANPSSPRIIELYASGTVNFTNYRIQTEGNGMESGVISWNLGLDLSPLGTVTNSFIYLVSTPTTTFNEMYPSITLPDLGVQSPSLFPVGNGNDAFRIVTTDGATPTPNLVSIVDQFGNPNDFTGGSLDFSAPWGYRDSYAKRNNGVGPNGGNFVTSSFTYGGDSYFLPASNSTCSFIANAIQLGTFTLAKQDFEISGLKIYPNPVTNGNLYITSDSGKTKQVVIFDVLGKQVVKTNVTKQPVNVSALNSGVYMVKISEDGKTVTKKLVIR